MKTFSSFGDLGDFLYLCPCLKLVAEETGEPVILYAVNGLRPHDPITERLVLIRRLLESQDYIEALHAWEGEPVDYDCTHFRRAGHPFGVRLATLQAQWLGLDPNLTEPWLKVEPDPWSPIVVNRTSRYRNHFFPWAQLVESFGREIAFLGHPQEYHDFCESYGTVGYLPTADLYHAARIIAGSELFIGNQSSCGAIAEGLKHRLIQETDLSSPDCIYPRENATHCHNGELNFTACGREFSSKNRMFVRAHRNETPPGGWQVAIGEHRASSYAFELLTVEIVRQLNNHGIAVPANLQELIIEQNSTAHHDHPVARLKNDLSTR